MFYLVPDKKVVKLLVLSVLTLFLVNQTEPGWTDDGWTTAPSTSQSIFHDTPNQDQSFENKEVTAAASCAEPSKHYILGQVTTSTGTDTTPRTYYRQTANNPFAALFFPAGTSSQQTQLQRQAQQQAQQQAQIRRQAQLQLNQQRAQQQQNNQTKNNQPQHQVRSPQSQLAGRAVVSPSVPVEPRTYYRQTTTNPLATLFPSGIGSRQQMQASQQARLLNQQQLLHQQQQPYRLRQIPQQSVQQQIARQGPTTQYRRNGVDPPQPNDAMLASNPNRSSTMAWYDPLGLFTTPQVRTDNVVAAKTISSPILRAQDHDSVVAVAIARASRRFANQPDQSTIASNMATNTASSVRSPTVPQAALLTVANPSLLNNNQIQLPQRNPIQQVSYDTPTGKTAHPISAAPISNDVITEVATSPDLYKPWPSSQGRQNVQPSLSSSTGPYRQVSDRQNSETPVRQTARPSPPQSNFGGNFSNQQTRSDHASTSNVSPKISMVETRRNKTFGLGLGQAMLHEIRPSNDRKWSQNHAVLQRAEFNGNLVTIRNVRYSKYDSPKNYTTIYYDTTFNLSDIRTFDLVIVPFHAMPTLAHIQASFGFADGRHIAMSIEARYEEGEQYDPLAATLRQFELIYVLADERDLIRIGTDVNNNDVHIYRLKFEPSEVREIFIDALNRANRLAEKPEFYHPLRNSCVTNLMNHINKGRPKAIPREYRTLLPGLMDQYVFDLGLVDTTAQNFKEAKLNAKVNWLVEKYGDLEYFSAGIRQNMY